MKKRPVLLTLIGFLLVTTFFDACKDDEDPSPVITTVEPDHAAAGESVVINGLHFASDATVNFNGMQAVVTNVTSTQLTVTVPAGATSGAVSVTSRGKTAQGPGFSVEVPPTITAINPQSGKAGDPVTITGNNFSITASENTVKFNGIAASVSSATSTQLVVTVPSGITTGQVTVEVNGRTTTGPFFTAIPPVSITEISPTSGPACTTVTITGTNFSTTAADNVVKFNGVTASVKTATATQLVVTVPGGASTGALTVTANNQTATGADFTVLVNQATMTMDAVAYTYMNFCTSLVSNRFWISASGGNNSPKPSWAIHFTGLRPTTAGSYTADIMGERPGEVWDATPTTVNVSFDSINRMIVTFNVTLKGRIGTSDKGFSGSVTVY